MLKSRCALMAVKQAVRPHVRTLRTSSVALGAHTPPPKPAMLPYQEPNYVLYEQNDIVWDDGVAAELALDFDAPHISTHAAASYLVFGGFGFFGLVYFLVHLSDPASMNPAKPRFIRVDGAGNPLDE